MQTGDNIVLSPRPSLWIEEFNDYESNPCDEDDYESAEPSEPNDMSWS